MIQPGNEEAPVTATDRMMVLLLVTLTIACGGPEKGGGTDLSRTDAESMDLTGQEAQSLWGAGAGGPDFSISDAPGDSSKMGTDLGPEVGTDLPATDSIEEPVEPLPPFEPTGFVSTDGKYFRDEQGALLIMHGTNVSNGSKSAPFFPDWLEPEHFEMLASRGINVIRFLVIWEAIEPEKGIFDQEYLDMVEERVAWATSQGIYVLVDMHQDIWGPKFGGDGAPLWATLDHDEPFAPPPGDWFLKYGEPAVKQSFDSFYANEEGIRDHFILAWQEVAKRFADNPMVIGYDLINEPFMGSWETLKIPQFEAEVLTPFYAEVAAAIREHDSHHIIFVEPTASKGLGINGGIGSIGDDLVAYAAHYYHPTMDMMHAYWDEKESVAFVFDQIRDEAWAMGGPAFLGEFGFYQGDEGDTLYAEHQTEVMEERGVSYTIWSFDRCGGGFCLLDQHGDPLWALEYITVTYAQRIAGQLVSSHYDQGSRTLDFSYLPSPEVAGHTEIFVPALNHPLGVRADCRLADGATCEAIYVEDESLVRVKIPDGEEGIVSVTVSPATPYPAPIPGLSVHVSLNNVTAQEQELQLEEDLGVEVLRTDFRWSKIEPVEGQFDFAQFDGLVANASDHGLEMLVLLDYSQDWGETEPGNQSTLDVNKWATFAGQTSLHYLDSAVWFEVWNEPNLDKFWSPTSDPVHYGSLLKAAATAIRSSHPTAKVVFGGLSSSDVMMSGTWPFLEAALHAHPDLGNYFDVLAIHPYTLAQSLSPEEPNPAGTYEQTIDETRTVLGHYGLARKPIVFTEMGWPACPCPPLKPPAFIPNVTYDQQAAYLVRSFLLAWTRDVRMYLWYDFYDGSGNNSIFSEDYFGLMTYDADPDDGLPPEKKPAYLAYQALIPMLDGRFFGADLSPDAKCRLLQFDGDAGLLLAGWQAMGAQPCAFEVPLNQGETATLRDGFGAHLESVDGPATLQFQAEGMPAFAIVGQTSAGD